MPTTLCFDFGNTRLKCAVFFDDKLQKVVVLPDASLNSIEKILAEYKPEKTLLSSVINHDEAIENLLSQHSLFHKLTHKSKLSITTPVGKPETIGADRLGLVVAAVHLFPEQHNLVIGLGSCITFNFINRFHEFLGGSISPGLEMRFKSMNDYTAKLPLIKPDWNFSLVGHDTRTNLLSGVILGMSKEIDGIIDLYKERYSNFNAILTGGDMAFFVPHIKNKIFADPDLIYKGLYAISEINNQT